MSCLQPSPSSWTLLRPTRTWRWRTWVWSGTAAEERYRKCVRKRIEPTPRCTLQPGLYGCKLAVSLSLDYWISTIWMFAHHLSVFRSALMSPKRAPTARPGRDRFTAESYTVLGKNMYKKPEKWQELGHKRKKCYFKHWTQTEFEGLLISLAGLTGRGISC